MAGIEGLISELGAEGFRAGLYGYLDELAGADHVSLLRFDADGRARLVCAASRPRWRFPQDAQRAYLEQFHAQDPNRGVFAARPQPGAQVRRLRREQVPGADYRHYCYDAARLVDRLSVLCGDGGGGSNGTGGTGDAGGNSGRGETAVLANTGTNEPNSLAGLLAATGALLAAAGALMLIAKRRA